jgi:signal transduction histidine kinase
MNKYRKFAGIFLGIELILIAISNVLFFIMAHINEPGISRTQETTGTIYKVIYTQTDHKTLILMNVGMGIMFLLSVFLVMYIGKKILKPFHRMMSLTEELAKGNLSVTIKAEKSKFFGRFLWGMDMLRDNLESSREKELELQKEKKTLILSLAHDLKTPLSAIRLYNKALSENLYDTPEKRAQVYAGIDKNVTEMEGYVTEIMAASRENFLNLTVEMGEVYLSSVMEYISAYYTDKLSNLHTTFEVIAYDLLAGIFAFEYTVYLCDQYIHIKRFADVIVRSNLQAFKRAFLIGFGTCDKYVCVRGLSYPRADRKTIKSWQTDIKHQKLCSVLLKYR